MSENINKGKPSAREILQAQIRKRAKQNQLIHREFGDFAFSSLLKKNNDLVKLISDGQNVSARQISKHMNRIATVEVSDIDSRSFMRSALAFWYFQIKEKKHNRRPYDLMHNIQPLDKMMK